MKKTPLLFLCHRIPYPPNKGDKIRSFHLLHHLSQHFDIYLATFVDDPQDWPWVADVEKFCVDSLFLGLNPTTARLRSLSGFLTGKVLSLPYYHNTQMHAWIRSRIAKHDISHLLVFSAAMAQYVLDSETPFQRKVIDFVDVDSDKWQQYALQKRWPMNWVYRREGELLLNFEREVARLFDAGLFVSSNEAAMFRGLAPESAHKVSHYNNGVNTAYFAADDSMSNPYLLNDRVLVFTGAMDYWPNIDAVVWFCGEILPSIRRLFPDIKFYIVGSNPSKVVQQLANNEGVTVTGRVKDIRPYIQHAVAAVAPMRIARGVQNKVLEAMAMEKPVIVSRKGLEGLEARHAEHVLLVDGIDDYVDMVAQIISGAFSGIGSRALQFVKHGFDWDKNLPEVVLLLAGETTNSAQTGAGI